MRDPAGAGRAETGDTDAALGIAVLPDDESVDDSEPECEPAVRLWDRWLAKVVSAVASPPVLIGGMTVMQASILAGQNRWLWTSVYLSIAGLAPLAYLVYLVRHGEVGDLYLRRRRQRIKPQLVTVGCFSAGWAVLQFGGGPAPMTALAAALLLQAAAVLGITLRWKISVHCATAAGAGVVVWGLFGALAPSIIAVLLVAWSRVRLRHHTPAQAAAGLALGFALFRLVL